MIPINYIGVGLTSPLVLVNGEATMSTDRALITQSMNRILGEQRGSRYFGYDFGSRIDEILFEPNDEVLLDLLRMFVIEALSKWEKRAKIETVGLTQYHDRIDCEIQFKVLPSNEIDSFIFPFYRTLKT